MVDVRTMMEQKIPLFFEKTPKIVSNTAIYLLKKLLCEEHINSFLRKNEALEDFDFISSALDELNFTYKTNNKAKEIIPSTGRVIIIANHPLGALDALCLLHFVSEIRKDVKIMANDLLSGVSNLQNLMLSVDVTNKKSLATDLKKATSWLENDGALIVFPAGEVSRVRPNGIKDTKWESGILHLASKCDAPIAPVYVKAKNSWLFYTVSSIYKPFAMFLLPREMYGKYGKTLELVIGESIPAQYIGNLKINKQSKLKLLKKHLYLIGNNKKGIFDTQKTIARGVDKKELRDEVYSGIFLGETSDGKKIYLCDFLKTTPLLKELGRLREIAFRKVGEGSGHSRDNDSFDLYYSHIVLWDEFDMEIVGSYRVGHGYVIYGSLGKDGFYSSTLFNFSSNLEELLPSSIELGRSFVQPKYWGSRALDYLWQGIGAYIVKNPDIRYMFGPVSISGSYPKAASKALAFVYSKHFPAEDLYSPSFNPLALSDSEYQEYSEIFSADNYNDDFKTLKRYLKNFGLTVPTLYKQYAELCDAGGVKFLDFGVDESFGYCVDGLIVVEIDKIIESKRQRYMTDYNQQEIVIAA